MKVVEMTFLLRHVFGSPSLGEVFDVVQRRGQEGRVFVRPSNSFLVCKAPVKT